MQIYNHEHGSAIDPDELQRFVELHGLLLLIADAIDAETLGGGLRQSAAQAFNTLGNHFATQFDEEDDKEQSQLDAAIDAYSQAIHLQLATAMFYRNRAGTYITLGDLATA